VDGINIAPTQQSIQLLMIWKIPAFATGDRSSVRVENYQKYLKDRHNKQQGVQPAR
jgi:hypothetical protein